MYIYMYMNIYITIYTVLFVYCVKNNSHLPFVIDTDPLTTVDQEYLNFQNRTRLVLQHCFCIYLHVIYYLKHVHAMHLL